MSDVLPYFVASETIAKAMAAAHREAAEWICEPLVHRISISYILEACAEHYGVSVVQIKSPSRALGGPHSRRGGPNVVRPRHVAMYLARQLTDRSFGEIGRLFRRDSTTVWNAVDRMSTLLKTDPKLHDDIETIKGKLWPAL
jgi:chromosomal replication initiator protein